MQTRSCKKPKPFQMVFPDGIFFFFSEKHGSYTAELKAATLASKLLFDIVKVLHDVFHIVPMCEMGF